ncbi:hypothetical protein IAT38_007067 [Cryptococcus sp. DSM 104549]
MAAHVPDSGPLDDYFRDEGDEPQVQSLEGEMGSRDSKGAKQRRGSESAEASQSTTTSYSRRQRRSAPSGVPDSPIPLPGIYPSTQTPDDNFAEQFKYLICSSGLLEKDYVPGLSGGVDDEAKTVDRWTEARMWVAEARVWVEKGRERWDLVAAGACLLVGLAVGLGLWVFCGLLLVCGLGVGGVVYSKKWHSSLLRLFSKAPSVTPQAQAVTALSAFLSQSHSLNTTLSESLSLLKPYPSTLASHHELRLALHRLTDNMTDHIATATSTLLELTDRKELAVLGEMYDIPVVGSFFYSRRRAEYSSSEQDARDMMVPSPRRATRPRPISTPSPSKRPVSLRGFPSTTGPSPGRFGGHSHRNQHLSIMSMPDPNDRFTAVPERTPRLSKRASFDRDRTGSPWGSSQAGRPRHERRITETAEEGDEADAGADADADRSFGSNSGSSSEEGDKTYIQGLKEKVSPESAASSDAGQGSRHSPTTPSTPLSKLRPISSPYIPSPLSRRFSHNSQASENGMIPLRTAPLASNATGSSSLLPSPFETDFPSAPLLSPALFARSFDQDPGRKRRSLQNFPYYPSSDEGERPGAEGLTRTRSMPISHLQALRTAGRSRRASEVPGSATTSFSGASSSGMGMGAGIGLGLPNTFPPDKRSSFTMPSPLSARAPLQRVNSVSPLTTPALTASSLGIHLKRRRMACCLLGLRFEEKDDAYWVEVTQILEELARRMQEEREGVDDVARRVRRDVEIAETLDTLVAGASGDSEVGISPVQANFPFQSIGGGRDFAPRTSDEKLLAEHIDKMSSSLVKAWAQLSGVRAMLAEGSERSEGADKWAGVRERLGEVVREWERGKDVVGRLAAGRSEHPEEGEESEERDGGEGSLPDFIRGWDSSTSRSTSLETDRHSFPERVHLAEHPEERDPDTAFPAELLPPPGKDTVFEGESAPLQTGKALLSGLSREQRIALMKEARTKGVRVEELLGVETPGADAGRREEEVRRKGGEVVDELMGVIGVIRQMKEPGAEGNEKHDKDMPLHDPSPVAAHATTLPSNSTTAPTRPLPPPPSSPHENNESSCPAAEEPTTASSNPHLAFDIRELQRSLRISTGGGGDEHVVG